MKYCSENEKIHKFIDRELSETESLKIEKHLSVCSECQNAFDFIHQTRTFLIAQPPILPSGNFDKEMLRLIETKAAKNQEKKGFLSIFSSFPLKLGFAALVAIIALGITFQLGRMSVSPLPQNVLSQDLPAEKKTDSPTSVKETLVSQPPEKIVTQVKTVTKYVQIPVVKKIKEEKIVYVNNSKKANLETPILPKQENTAKNFNLKDLQPVSEVSYRIIRKGENNE